MCHEDGDEHGEPCASPGVAPRTDVPPGYGTADPHGDQRSATANPPCPCHHHSRAAGVPRHPPPDIPYHRDPMGPIGPYTKGPSEHPSATVWAPGVAAQLSAVRHCCASHGNTGHSHCPALGAQHRGHGTGDVGCGVWGMRCGHGIWDTGYGTWDMGHGIWDSGYGRWDMDHRGWKGCSPGFQSTLTRPSAS